MDALTLLHQDHVAVASLFVEYVATQDRQERTTIVEQLRTLLSAHSEIEETMVYPRLREQAPDKEIVGVAFEISERMVRRAAPDASAAADFATALFMGGIRALPHPSGEDNGSTAA